MLRLQDQNKVNTHWKLGGVGLLSGLLLDLNIGERERDRDLERDLERERDRERDRDLERERDLQKQTTPKKLVRVYQPEIWIDYG